MGELVCSACTDKRLGVLSFGGWSGVGCRSTGGREEEGADMSGRPGRACVGSCDARIGSGMGELRVAGLALIGVGIDGAVAHLGATEKGSADVDGCADISCPDGVGRSCFR